MPFGGMVQVLGGLATDKATSAEGVHRLGTLGAWYMSPDGQTLLRLVQNGDGSALTQYAAVAWKNPAAGSKYNIAHPTPRMSAMLLNCASQLP